MTDQTYSYIGTFDIKECSTCRYSGNYPTHHKCSGCYMVDGDYPNWEEILVDVEW